MSNNIIQLIEDTIAKYPVAESENYSLARSLGKEDGAIVGKVKRNWDEYWDSAKDAYHDQQKKVVEKVKESGIGGKIKDAVSDNKVAATAAGAIGAGLGGMAVAKNLRKRQNNN